MFEWCGSQQSGKRIGGAGDKGLDALEKWLENIEFGRKWAC